jgi:asparaginyl-tRNA synthetase
MSYLEKFQTKYTDSYISVFTIDKYYNEFINNKNIINVKGWIQSCRKQSTNLFIQFYDGSIAKNLQIIFLNYIGEHNNIPTGTTIEISGIIVKSPAKGQEYEMQGIDIQIIGIIQDPSTYLPCVKGIKLENLRNKAYIKPKFQSMRAIYRIRNNICKAIHKFFELNNCFQIDPNIITTSDCEGAGEVFTITTLLNNKNNINVDFNKDFFEKQAFLTVSSQLQLEALCSGMSKVYTFNPSFRAEPSQTNRHVACFTHVEWEFAFINLEQLMDLNEDIIKYTISYILDNSFDDLQLLNKFISPNIINKLINIISEPFIRITYSEAIDIINDNIQNIKNKYPDTEIPKWGDDLSSNCEKYLTEHIFSYKPILVYNYPISLKSFYMKKNDDNMTCQSCDLLIPSIGEVIGSSIREDNYDNLLNIINDRKMDTKSLEWYINLRKDATFPHGGSGLGIDRLISFCTLNDGSIKDVIPFPISYKDCNY